MKRKLNPKLSDFLRLVGEYHI